MNAQLEKFARNYIKAEIAKLPSGWQDEFKLMYGRSDFKVSVDNILRLKIDDVIDRMECEKLDWAMTQIDNSIAKLQEKTT